MKLGLRSKLLIPILGIVIICMSLASLFSSMKASDELWRALTDSSRHIAEGLARSLEIFTADIEGTLRLQAKDERLVAALRDRSPEALKVATAVLGEITRSYPSIQGTTLLGPNGDILATDVPSSTTNFADRQYFQLAMQGQTNISQPLMSRVTNKPVFLAATPVSSDGKILGVLYVRVDLGRFTETMVEPIKVGQSGYAFLADKSGIVFSHPDKSLVLKMNLAETDWGRTMLGAGSGVVRYEFRDSEVSAVFTKVEKTGWLVAVRVETADIAAASGAVLRASLLCSAIGILLVSAVIIFTVWRVLKGLDACVLYSESVARGDLNSAFTLTRRDELGRLADSLRMMVGSLRKMIDTATQKTKEAESQTTVANRATAEADQAKTLAESKATDMKSAAGRLEGVVSVISTASDGLSAQIEQSSRGSDAQARRMDATAAAMEEMNATVLEVAKNAAQAAKISGEARKKAEEGAMAVDRVVSFMEQVRDTSRQSREDMADLGKQAENIGQILGVISDIADQTNLLALNAAIEAARAGDAGRGFAVVADEVRKLAEKTMSATKEVGQVIGSIQDGTRKNLGNVAQSVSAIEEASALAGTSRQTLREIVALVDTTADQVRSIATASEEQSATSEEINKSIEEVSRISSEMAQAMQESGRSVESLVDQARELSTLIKSLQS